MESLYHQTNKLVQDVGRELGRLERAGEDSAHIVENEIQAQLDHIISNCERLDILVTKEPVTRRSNAKMRVDQLKYDCQQVQAALRNLQHKRFEPLECTTIMTASLCTVPVSVRLVDYYITQGQLIT